MNGAADAGPWLRAAEAGDLAVLTEIHAAAFDRPWGTEGLASALRAFGVAGLVAGIEDQVSGFLLLRTVAGEAEILTLAVLPAARRRGIAHTLVEAAAGLATLAGAETFWLEVAEDNPGAVALYRHAGFVAEGRRPRYYTRPDGVTVDAVVMRRPLNSGHG
ncbi:MAG: GNAT family N-acetyltransferase [Caulobacteraceae bacterium]